MAEAKDKNWEALDQAVQSIRELGPLARRAGAEEMRERAARYLEEIIAMHRSGQDPVYACVRADGTKHFCEDFGCHSLVDFAAAIRALPLEEPKPTSTNEHAAGGLDRDEARELRHEGDE